MTAEQGPRNLKRGRTDPFEGVSVLDTDEESQVAYQLLPPSERTYERVKADVERRFFKMRFPFGFWLLRAPGQYTIYSFNHIAKVLGGVVYFDRTKAGGWVERDFKKRWKRDPYKRAYEHFRFDPTNIWPKDLNTFHGFAGSKLPSVPDGEVESLCAPVYSFIASLIGCPHDTRRLCDWFANLMQYPGRKSCIAPILHGSDVCGHKRFVDWIRLTLVGGEYSLTDTKELMLVKQPEIFEKLLMHVDSNLRMDSMAKAHVIHGTLGAITGERIHSNLNVIYTTTSEVTADPEWTNWRCCIFRCNEAPCSPELETHLQCPRVQRAFYQSLLKHDISSYKMDGSWSDFVSEFGRSRGVYTRQSLCAGEIV